MFHRTERLFLRPAWPEDWSEILAGIGEEAIARNLAKVPWPYGEAEARWFAGQRQERCRPNFLVVESASGRVVGSCGIGEYAGEPELGYWIARNAWGRGYATEAARGVIEVAKLLGIRRLTAGHFADNPASGRVIRKLGFRPTGTARRFSLARGCEVDSIEFARDLEEPAPVLRAA